MPPMLSVRPCHPCYDNRMSGSLHGARGAFAETGSLNGARLSANAQFRDNSRPANTSTSSGKPSFAILTAVNISAIACCQLPAVDL